MLIGPVLVPVYSWFAFWFSQDTSELWSFDSLSSVSFEILLYFCVCPVFSTVPLALAVPNKTPSTTRLCVT